MMDEYGKLHGHTPGDASPASRSRSAARYGREAATGRGLVLPVPRGGARARPRSRPRRASSSRASATSARGRRGSCSELGATLVGVSDAHGAMRNDGGIDADALRAPRGRRRHRCAEFAGAEPIDPEELPARLECEVLHPRRARRHDPRRERRPRSTAAWSSRARTRPTTPRADEILDDKGVFVVPDIWPTRAASSSPTSSGCRTSSTSAGTSARSTTSSARSCAAPSARSQRAETTTCRCAPPRARIERVLERRGRAYSGLRQSSASVGPGRRVLRGGTSPLTARSRPGTASAAPSDDGRTTSSRPHARRDRPRRSATSARAARPISTPWSISRRSRADPLRRVGTQRARRPSPWPGPRRPRRRAMNPRACAPRRLRVDGAPGRAPPPERSSSSRPSATWSGAARPSADGSRHRRDQPGRPRSRRPAAAGRVGVLGARGRPPP